MSRIRVATKTSEADVAVIKGMVRRGDRQMDVAVWAGVNQARVCEIARGTGFGKKYRNTPPAPLSELPPPGPYVVIAKTEYDRVEVEKMAAQEVVRALSELLEGYRRKLN